MGKNRKRGNIGGVLKVFEVTSEYDDEDICAVIIAIAESNLSALVGREQTVITMNIKKAEVDWYRKNGKHSDRITKDSNSEEYMIGDWSWNGAKKNINRQEFVEPNAHYDIKYA